MKGRHIIMYHWTYMYRGNMAIYNYRRKYYYSILIGYVIWWGHGDAQHERVFLEKVVIRQGRYCSNMLFVEVVSYTTCYFYIIKLIAIATTIYDNISSLFSRKFWTILGKFVWLVESLNAYPFYSLVHVLPLYTYE